MSEIRVNSLKGLGASTAAISVNNSDGTCTANLTSIGGSQLSNRNKVINGAMIISQRYGTTVQTGLSGNVSAYYIDRFKLELDNLGTWSISQSTDTPDGFGYSLKLDCTTEDPVPSSSDLLMISHRMEGQNLQDLQKGTSGAKKVVVSFYAKSTKTGTFIVELIDKDNSSRHINKSYTVSDTNWNRYTIEFAGDTTGTLDNDANRSLDLNFWLGGGLNYTSGTLQTSWGADTNANRYVGGTNLADDTSNEFYITGIQLEVSNMGVATDFEHRSFAQELQLCKRYFNMYSRTDSDSGNEAFIANGFYWSTSRFMAPLRFDVPMRTNSWSLYKVVGTNYFKIYNNGQGNHNVSDFGLNGQSHVSSAHLNIDSGISSSGDAGMFFCNNSAARIGFDAEL
tara:strand:+ start:205 stop:1392 length:1188 start_codon:yes stop_codon:yes gene_type:complete